MAITQVLKRKDASSVIVGVVVALILVPLLAALTTKLAGTISGLADGDIPGYGAGSWQVTYLFPVVFAAVQLLALEVLILLYTAVHDAVRNSTKK